MRLSRRSLPLFILLLTSAVSAQQARTDTNSKNISDALEKGGCTTREPSGVKICNFDYKWEGLNVEAISFRPPGDGLFPAVLLIPGHERTARDYISMGERFAQEGFACLSITQPGYGRTQVKPDYVGPTTIKVLAEGYRRFQREPYVNAKRMGIFGYSRGGMAASLLAVHLTDVKAAVFGAGIYDFKKAYDETKFDGIRKNMKAETGMTEEAIKQRSSVLQMERLNCPILILHGEKDENVPVSQALLLRDRLTALKKEFEIKIFPDREHGIGPENVNKYTLDFFRRKLTGELPKR
jgi:dipeptidyl aminopeptidase/acylaminoacyl peptidase